MGGYKSGRKAEHELTYKYRTINVQSARCFGYQIVYSEQGGACTGKRPWIICPCCQRRCGLLYQRLGSLPVCRECLHLIYPSQRQSDIEKKRTYERHQVLNGLIWTYEEWMQLPKRYLSYDEFTYYNRKWLFKIMRELLKMQTGMMRLLIQCIPDEKRMDVEAKIQIFERKQAPTLDDLDRAKKEIDALFDEIAA